LNLARQHGLSMRVTFVVIFAVSFVVDYTVHDGG